MRIGPVRLPVSLFLNSGELFEQERDLIPLAGPVGKSLGLTTFDLYPDSSPVVASGLQEETKGSAALGKESVKTELHLRRDQVLKQD